MAPIETWRGRRFTAHVLEVNRILLDGKSGTADAAGLAGTVSGMLGGRLAALWLAGPGTGPTGGRLAVAVTGPASPGGLR